MEFSAWLLVLGPVSILGGVVTVGVIASRLEASLLSGYNYELVLPAALWASGALVLVSNLTRDWVQR